MQPMKQLEKVLESLADGEHYLFTSSDFEAVLPGRVVSRNRSRRRESALTLRSSRKSAPTAADGYDFVGS